MINQDYYVKAKQTGLGVAGGGGGEGENPKKKNLWGGIIYFNDF